jgi:hypothetical protein
VRRQPFDEKAACPGRCKRQLTQLTISAPQTRTETWTFTYTYTFDLTFDLCPLTYEVTRSATSSFTSPLPALSVTSTRYSPGGTEPSERSI